MQAGIAEGTVAFIGAELKSPQGTVPSLLIVTPYNYHPDIVIYNEIYNSVVLIA